MPIFPMLALLAAFAALALARAGGRRLRGEPALGAGRRGRGAGRGDPRSGARSTASTAGSSSPEPTRATLTRAWMVAHVPQGAQIVAEPVVARPLGAPAAGRARPPASPSWCKYPSLRLSHQLERRPGERHHAGRDRGLRADAQPRAARLLHATWLLLGAHRLDRVGPRERRPAAVPGAVAYYRALAQQGEGRPPRSPYTSGQGPVAFGFDWSFDYYPLAYARPGPRDHRLPPARRRRGGGSLTSRRVILGVQCRACNRHRRGPPLEGDRARRATGTAPSSRTRSSERLSRAASEVLGEGWHQEYGGAHAEVNAIEACGLEDLRRRDALRVARALLPRGQDAALHRRDPPGRHPPRRTWPPTIRPRRRQGGAWASCATRASR